MADDLWSNDGACTLKGTHITRQASCNTARGNKEGPFSGL